MVFLDVIAWMRLFSLLEGQKVRLNAYHSFMVGMGMCEGEFRNALMVSWQLWLYMKIYVK